MRVLILDAWEPLMGSNRSRENREEERANNIDSINVCRAKEVSKYLMSEQRQKMKGYKPDPIRIIETYP